MPEPRPETHRPAAPQRRELTDPREMRAMAHPLRLRLMELLVLAGPLTATQCAERVGESPANCSFHLRTLARYGFVEEAEGGTGRQRPWRAIPRSHYWGEGPDQPTALRRAGRELSDLLLTRDLARLEQWQQERDAEPQQWREAALHVTASVLWLTAEELDAIRVEVLALLDRYGPRLADPDIRPPASRPVAMIAHLFPLLDTEAGDA